MFLGQSLVIVEVYLHNQHQKPNLPPEPEERTDSEDYFYDSQRYSHWVFSGSDFHNQGKK